MYSTSRKLPKRIPPYSVMKPWTSSASASGMSNGVRFVSAKPASMKIAKPTICGHDEPDVALGADDVDQRERAAHHDHPEQRQPHRDLVGDQLRRAAHRPEQAVFRARRPAAEQHPVEGDRADREEVEDADRDVDPVEADPVLHVPPGHDRQGEDAGEDRQQRSQDEQRRHRRWPGGRPPWRAVCRRPPAAA